MKILLIDNYDSFTYNLVYMLRELNCNFEVRRNDKVTLKEAGHFDRFILSPGPGVPKEAGILPELIQKYGESTPILGVCLGHQAIAEAYGATLYNLPRVQHGIRSAMQHQNGDALFHSIPERFMAGRYHSWAVQGDELPASLEVIATGEAGEIMAIRHRKHPLRGVQFHPESVMSEHGQQMIQNFLAL